MAERRDPISGQVKEPRGWRFYVVAVAGVLLLILVAQNVQQVDLNFLFIHTQTPLIVAPVIAGGLGALIGWALPHIRRSRRVERERDHPHD